MGIMAVSRTLRAQKIRVCVDAEPDSPSDLTEEHVRVSLTSLLTMEDVSSKRWEGEDKVFLLKGISEKNCMLLDCFCLLQCVTSVAIYFEAVAGSSLILAVTENSAPWIQAAISLIMIRVCAPVLNRQLLSSMKRVSRQ